MEGALRGGGRRGDGLDGAGIPEAPFVVPHFGVGAGLVSLGLYDLRVHRHLEIHEEMGELVTLHRLLLGGGACGVYPFGQILRLVVLEKPGDRDSDPRAILRVEMEEGRPVDLGGLYTAEEGQEVADRLAALFGVAKVTIPPGPR